jgi:FkbM family methyltransferase
LKSTVLRIFFNNNLLNIFIKNTLHGFKFTGGGGKSFQYFEHNEKDVVKIFNRIISRMDAFINIGAHHGYYCCLAQKKKVPTFAFEPYPPNLKFLYKNLMINNYNKKIEIFPIALSDKIGICKIFGKDSGASLLDGWGGQFSNELVYQSTLDHILKKRFNNREKILFLIDVEGSEKKILYQANSFINFSPKPIWIIEITKNKWPGGKDNPFFIETFKIFLEKKYYAYSIEHKILIKEFNKKFLNSLPGSNYIFFDKNIQINFYK